MKKVTLILTLLLLVVCISPVLAELSLQQNAVNFAVQLEGTDYLWGGKGFDYSQMKYADADSIKTGYTYWDPIEQRLKIDQGVDCSGLVMWSYNKAYGATKFQDTSNPIYYEGANGQWTDSSRFQQKSTLIPTQGDLTTGDLLFIGTVNILTPDHVGMYIGNGKVIHSKGEGTVEIKTLDEWLNLPIPNTNKMYRDYFTGYGNVIENDAVNLPAVSASSTTSVGPNQATLNGQLTSMGGATSCNVYFQYGTTTAYGETTSSQLMSMTGFFSEAISGLSPGTTYYYRVVASSSAGTVYGATQSFPTTTSITSPLITDVNPSQPEARDTKQWIIIIGSGFTSQSQVILRIGGNEYQIPADRTRFVNGNQIDVYVGLTNSGTWTAQIINPDNKKSNNFDFTVINPSSPSWGLDQNLVSLINTHAPNYYNENWEISLSQYKAWIALISLREAGYGRYVAHSQYGGGYDGDRFDHIDQGSAFRFSTGIGAFQLDRGGSLGNAAEVWDKMPTIEKLNPEISLLSTLRWHRDTFGSGSTLADFSSNSAWLAVRPDKESDFYTNWNQITGSNWYDSKNNKLDVQFNPPTVQDQFENQVENIGKIQWSLSPRWNGLYDTWKISARNWGGDLVCEYYYTYNNDTQNNGNGWEIWVYNDPQKSFTYYFEREYKKWQFPEERVNDLAGSRSDISIIALGSGTTTPTVDYPKWTGDFHDDPIQILLARAIFGEARGEDDQGKLAVGWVIRNRADNPRWWGSDYYRVILKENQFSCFNAGDPNLEKLKDPMAYDENSWRKCYEIAGRVLSGSKIEDITLNSDHYHSIAIPRPDTWDEQKFIIQIGNHKFYRLELGETSSISNVDVALIIDSSGSMGGNDPTDLRKSAAKLFIDLVEDQDKITIVDFDESVRVWQSLIITAGNRDTLKNAVNKVDSSGSTNIGGGLRYGYDQLNGAAADALYEKAAVLLTDGQHNTGTSPSAVVPDYQVKGWPIYTIALSDYADKNLLEQMAVDTGGQFYTSPSPESLQDIYNRISQKIKGSSQLTAYTGMIGQGQTISGSLPIDPSVKSFNLVLTWPGSDLDLVLYYPNGNQVLLNQSRSSGTDDPAISFITQKTYEIYKVQNAVAGTWRYDIKGIDVQNQEDFTLTLSAATTIRVVANPDKMKYNLTDPVQITAQFSDQNLGITGAQVTGKVTLPDLSQDTIVLSDIGNGSYSGIFSNTTQQGIYKILLEAQKGGVIRQQQVDFSIIAGSIAKPIANFTATPTAGYMPVKVQFNDTSTGIITSYQWDFENDGSVDSSEKNPVFTYTNPGMYNVTLTVIGPGGSDNEVKTDYVTVTANPRGRLRSSVRLSGIRNSPDYPDGIRDSPGYSGGIRDSPDYPDGNMNSREYQDRNRYSIHIYEGVYVPGGITWDEANADAIAKGGHLAVITSEEENELVFNIAASDERLWIYKNSRTWGPWLGGYQTDGSQDPASGWTWVTNEAWNYTNWETDEPNDQAGQNENRLLYFSLGNVKDLTWNDEEESLKLNGYILEKE